MKVFWIALFVLASVPLHQAIGGVGTNSPASLRTNFVADAVLTPDDLAAVVRLAESSGMAEVAVVETFHYPMGHKFIRVTSPERTDGRKIRFETLVVSREGWAFQAKPAGPLTTISADEFWVKPLSLQAHELTMFDTPKGTVRVEVKPGIALPVADRIVRAFTTGKVKVSKADAVGLDCSQPAWLESAQTQGHYVIGFSGNLNRYEFILQDDEVQIVSVTCVRY